MKKNATILLTLLSLVFMIQRAEGQTNLTNLINFALEHNHLIRKSNLQIKETDYMVREAIGQGLPQVDGSTSYLETKSPDKLYAADAYLRVTQLIYSQSYWAGLKTVKKTQELYSILKENNKDSIIAEIANGYYQAGSLTLQLQTVDKSLLNLKELLRIAELQYKGDFIKETDVSRLKVTITNLEVTRQTIQNGISSQNNYLKALAGMPINSSIGIDTSSFIIGIETRQEKIEFQAEKVPIYQTLMKQAEIYKQQTKLSVAQYCPTLAAFAKIDNASYNTKYNMDSWNKTTTFGLSLTAPLFTSGSNYAKVKQMSLKELQLEEDILQTKEFLKVVFDNAISEYQTAHNLLVVQEENRKLAQKVYNQSLLQYQESMISLADLLTVNSELLQADNSYNQQLLKCKTSEIKILKSSGNLKFLINNN